MNLFHKIIFLGLCLTVCGCVTRTVLPPLSTTALIVTRSGNEARLQWESSPDALYTLLYAKNRSAKAQWTTHEDCIRRRGTGRIMSLVDIVDRGSPRRYRLHIEPLYPANGRN